MNIPDVNVLVSAFRTDAVHYEVSERWLRTTIEAGEADRLARFAVVSGFLRVVTNVRAFDPPSEMPDALARVDFLLATGEVRWLKSGPGYWDSLKRLLESAPIRANLVSDAHIAAIALNEGATVVTLDRDFKRLKPVKTRFLI
jgi:toxin-antitoxin system PIN domain toxin